MSAALAANGVKKRYGNLVALADLSFEAQPGEILGVLGPKGAGKTTAIRILMTILRPTRRTFKVGGVPDAHPAEIRRRIGVLPESASYPEHQTGEEFLRYHARLYGATRADARATALSLLAELGLDERRRSLIAIYSRGMRQRLGIARARQRAAGRLPRRADARPRPPGAAADALDRPADRSPSNIRAVCRSAIRRPFRNPSCAASSVGGPAATPCARLPTASTKTRCRLRTADARWYAATVRGILARAS